MPTVHSKLRAPPTTDALCIRVHGSPCSRCSAMILVRPKPTGPSWPGTRARDPHQASSEVGAAFRPTPTFKLSALHAAHAARSTYLFRLVLERGCGSRRCRRCGSRRRLAPPWSRRLLRRRSALASLLRGALRSGPLLRRAALCSLLRGSSALGGLLRSLLRRLLCDLPRFAGSRLLRGLGNLLCGLLSSLLSSHPWTLLLAAPHASPPSRAGRREATDVARRIMPRMVMVKEIVAWPAQAYPRIHPRSALQPLQSGTPDQFDGSPRAKTAGTKRPAVY